VRVALAGEGEAVLLSVSNRGPVIPPELVHRLFEPFQQGTDGRGTLGLGLFIVREIVRAHGGTIEVRSSDDLTTFAVTAAPDCSAFPLNGVSPIIEHATTKRLR